MLGLLGNAQIFLYRGATDMRKSFDGLCGMIEQHFSLSVMSGNVFVFVNRRRDRVKLLYFDGDGLAIFYKRLEKGTFRVPVGPEGEAELSSAELSMLLEGITPLRVGRRWQAPRRAAEGTGT